MLTIILSTDKILHMNESFSDIPLPELNEEVDLSNLVIGIRVYKIGHFNAESLGRFTQQVANVDRFHNYLSSRFGLRSPKIVILTNSDLVGEGLQILKKSNLEIVTVNPDRAARRASLAKKVVGETSNSSGEMSFADMLNTLESSDGSSQDQSRRYLFISSDIVGSVEKSTQQVEGMQKLFTLYEKGNPGQLALVGSVISNQDNNVLVQQVLDGSSDLNIDNLSNIFPNNACSMVPPGARFSGITDNALAGMVSVDGKVVPIGGNEDFLYGFKEMLNKGKDCVILVDSSIERLPDQEVLGTDSKYTRRQAVYRLYAERLVKQAILRGKIDHSQADQALTTEQIEKIIEDIIDKHLFFAQLDEKGQPTILLAGRQQMKSIKMPSL